MSLYLAGAVSATFAEENSDNGSKAGDNRDNQAKDFSGQADEYAAGLKKCETFVGADKSNCVKEIGRAHV